MKRGFQWFGLTMILSSLGLLDALTRPVQGQEYTNIDSIEVHGLVYIGKLNKSEYSYEETIRAELVVANRSNVPVSLYVGYLDCEPILLHDVWCKPDSCTNDPNDDLRFCIGCRTCPTEVLFQPGEHSIQQETLISRYPGSGWQFNLGRVVFADPWSMTIAPSWTFAVGYRRGSTRVASYTWSAVKSLYR